MHAGPHAAGRWTLARRAQQTTRAAGPPPIAPL